MKPLLFLLLLTGCLPHESEEAKTMKLIAEARAVIAQHKAALYRAVEMDEQIILRQNLSDKVCGINIDYFDGLGAKVKCEIQ